MSENLLSGDRHIDRNTIKNCRLNKPAVRHRQRFTPKAKSGTRFSTLVDIAEHLSVLRLAGDGSDFRLLIQRVTTRPIADQLNEPAHELLGDRALNNQPAAAVTTFSLIKADAKNSGVRSSRQV